jgi:ElaB/YqjD/DUF883 family membrane-anchored ribosome-binding protein
MDEHSGDLVLTYAELGERLGITSDSARLKAKRKADRGEWAFVARNSERDPVRVRVPASDLPEHPPERSPGRTEHGASDGGALGELMAELAELKASVAELGETYARAARASAEAAEARLQAAVAAAKLEAAERRTEIEVAARNAVIEELRAELARLRRPWWRRLLQ